MTKSDNKIRLFFYSFWSIVAICQAIFMELIPDEAYYWMYSNNLDWGYLDHPPMVALWISITKWIPGEIGVRLLMVVANISFIYLLEKLVKPTNVKLFYALVSSLAIIHFGILAVPDVPLVLFSMFFLFRFKKYLENDNLVNSLLLAITVALMMYSKYQGVILVLLALIPNWRLLGKKSFYIVFAVSTFCFLPHLFWQYENGWPSHYFHLHERSPEDYNIKNTLTYPFEQILAFGPITGIVLLIGAWKYEIQSSFEKTLKVIVFGLFIFLLGMTFKGPVELNWSVIAIGALVYLGYKGMENRKVLRKWGMALGLASAVLLLLARVFITINPFPEVDFMKREFGNKAWTESVKSVAKGRPLVFENSYQQSSLYAFYSGEEAITVNNPGKRMNQYDIWDLDTALLGREVLLYSPWSRARVDSYPNPKGGYFYTEPVAKFVCYKEFSFEPEKWVYKGVPGKNVEIKLTGRNGGGYTFLELGEKPKVTAQLNFYKEFVDRIPLDIDMAQYIKGGEYTLSFPCPTKPGKYSIRLSIKPHNQPSSYNSKRIYIIVE